MLKLSYAIKASKAKVAAIALEAETQVRGYLQSEDVQKLQNLHSYILVFGGTKLKVMKEIRNRSRA